MHTTQYTTIAARWEKQHILSDYKYCFVIIAKRWGLFWFYVSALFCHHKSARHYWDIFEVCVHSLSRNPCRDSNSFIVYDDSDNLIDYSLQLWSLSSSTLPIRFKEKTVKVSVWEQHENLFSVEKDRFTWVLTFLRQRFRKTHVMGCWSVEAWQVPIQKTTKKKLSSCYW